MRAAAPGRPKARAAPWLALALGLAWTAGLVLIPASAPAIPNEPVRDTFELTRPDPLVRRVQKGLAETGSYKGPINGVRDSEIERAVRAYQKANGIKEDGLINEDLAQRIETASRVSALLGRLEKARRETMEAARRALLSRPETRHLIGPEKDEAADPTRDASPCFRQPTPACLLAEAVETSKAIAAVDQRDWALGELLTAQAKAGFAEGARQTLRRMRDPRQVMVSLRDIAETEALAGRSREAIEAADIIPDPLKRTEAHGAVAEIAARRGDKEAALAATAGLKAGIEAIEGAAKRVGFQARLASLLMRIGDAEGAEAALAQALALARGQETGEARTLALRSVATAQAEMGRPAEALALLDDLGEGEDRLTVLIAAAAAQAEAGDIDKASQSAAAINEGRYRGVALAKIAALQIKRGEPAAAEASLAAAGEALDGVKLPFARDYGLSRIAAADVDLAKAAAEPVRRADFFGRAVEAAGKIEDKRLRAYTFLTIAAERRRAGDADGAAATASLGETATEEIQSRLSQVWMLADLAASHLDAGDGAAARQSFERALALTADVRNAWGRTRLLSRLAASLVRLELEAPAER